jgi:hypothetical protein
MNVDREYMLMMATLNVIILYSISLLQFSNFRIRFRSNRL